MRSFATIALQPSKKWRCTEFLSQFLKVQFESVSNFRWTLEARAADFHIPFPRPLPPTFPISTVQKSHKSSPQSPISNSTTETQNFRGIGLSRLKGIWHHFDKYFFSGRKCMPTLARRNHLVLLPILDKLLNFGYHRKLMLLLLHGKTLAKREIGVAERFEASNCCPFPIINLLHLKLSLCFTNLPLQPPKIRTETSVK